MSKWYRPYMKPLRDGVRRLRGKPSPRRAHLLYNPYMFLRSYDPNSLSEEVSTGYHTEDKNIANRIVSSYNLEMGPYDQPTDMWEHISNIKQKEVHKILKGTDKSAVIDVLRRPGHYEYMYGFASVSTEISKKFSKSVKSRKGGVSWVKDIMVALAESIGALRCENPESGQRLYKDISNDDLLSAIEAKLGVEINVPNPFPDEPGIRTRRGIIDIRAAQAIYQAWRVRCLTEGIERPKILEIGGGLGKTAYFAYLLGIKDFTIIDLPFTGVSQANFLMRALGEEAIALHGEACEASDRIKLLRPGAFLDSDQRYDLILNVDSLTEMGRPVAERYFSKIVGSTNSFLSINHEYNSYTVAELSEEYQSAIKSTHRHLYALRRGYAEELFTFR